MQYTETFVIEPDACHYQKDLEGYITHLKKRGGCRIGGMIAETILFKELPYGEGKKFELVVQAFPQDSWIKFKQQLKEYIEAAEKTGLATFNLVMVGKMLKELDSFHVPDKTEIK